MLAINLETPLSIMMTLQVKFKHRRLFLNLTQEGLSSRSGVSLGSLKRFEHSGQISLESLLKLAHILECLDDFNTIADEKTPSYNSIEEIIQSDKKVKTKKRGSLK